MAAIMHKEKNNIIFDVEPHSLIRLSFAKNTFVFLPTILGFYKRSAEYTHYLTLPHV